MGIKVYSFDEDLVIKSFFCTGITNYKYALEKLYPLINKLEIQRKVQQEKFYKRLETDIEKGCIMPPITLAFVNESKKIDSLEQTENFIRDNISSGFILDGIQRLNTLSRVSNAHSNLDNSRPLFMNVIICPSKDNLLYRMITLNNGQRPMTARHQIEVLTSHIYDFEEIGLKILSEKESLETRDPKSFKKSDIISAYIAFLSDTINLENNKIIEEKMDELIAKKILESNIPGDGIEFTEVLSEISRLKEDDTNAKWLRNNNNLIGFCVGIKKSLNILRQIDPSELSYAVENFEKAFNSFDVSKIKLSRERRKLSKFFIEEFEKIKNYDESELLLSFNELD